MTHSRTCTAFIGEHKIASGHLIDIASKIKVAHTDNKKETILIFDDLTSAQLEIDLRGSTEDVLKRLKKDTPSPEPTGPGRPRLGVVAKEVTLLPTHWEWLALQPGGASATLRKLIEAAKKTTVKTDRARQAQDATYKFMMVMAGDRPQYEEALRALYAKKKEVFEALIAPWPKDIRKHLLMLSKEVFNEPME